MGKKDQVYEVEAIIGKRRKKNSGSVEYRVLWNGYPKEQATWEPEEHLENVQYMIEEFNKKIEQRSVSQKKQNPPPPTVTITTSKKPVDEGQAIVQETKRKETNQKLVVRKSMKESDSECNDAEQEDIYQVKKRSVTATRGRPPLNRVQEESKTVERKVTPPPRTAIRSIATENRPQSPPEMKRPPPQKIDLQRQTESPQEAGFSSDDESPEPILQVTGMFLNENGRYGFAVLEKKNNRRVTMKRREVIKRDPLALIRFYERALNPTF